ncbi:serine/threonine-protein phosphatase 6 regulatory subunit 3-B isoform X2 [Ananas comosus]|uniref:Serine/threonine-protein phosphatase 6 regulatory subunit 3-B isoform X2 n=1 Tax=Ananas comosus TaxID=4615 RepID=A0A6P5GBY9_ANACO|nr:serine/threonine-protein phosphatase 6 regulatory subunit 3-B isoform X2 [Ananas comosus]
MFWRMTGLSTASPVDAILDKENFKLEELLDEDEIIQECKALNTRLINFLRDRPQVEQLLRYIVEEAPDDAEKKRTFRFPFIACEIFTCEVDIILRALVEDEELMHLLFSFLKPDHSHSTLLAGYFSKVVICLMLRKTGQLVNYVQGHPEIISQLVDLIGITSIMEVLIRLIGADESMYSNYAEAMQWLEDTNVLEMIVDKFSSSDYPEVHANAAEILCAITRYAPPALAAKICSPSFVERLFRHALEDSRPKSVLVHSLSVCISLLDPKRLVSASYQAFRSPLSHGTLVTVSPETVDGMLESLGGLLKLLDVSSADSILPTTYGKLQPPLGKHRLKIVEFISVLLSIGSEAAETQLIRLGALRRVIDLFFEYPFNNFLHHHVENIIVSCLESKRNVLIEHVLNDCNIVGKILEAEKQPTLQSDSTKPTVRSEGKSPPRIGNVGHMTRLANKLIQLGNNNCTILTHLQQNSEWVDWHTNVLLKRNAVENVYQWTCGRPTSLQDRGKDSDDEDFRDRDYDVAALANNLSQAFRYGIYNNDDFGEAQGSIERDDEDVYFDDESAEVVISSLRLGDDQEGGSLFTNSNWFAFEEDRAANDRSIGSLASPSPNSGGTSPSIDEADEIVLGQSDKVVATPAPLPASDSETSQGAAAGDTALPNGPVEELEEDSRQSSSNTDEKPPEQVEWREELDSGTSPETGKDQVPDVRDGEVELEKDKNSINEDASNTVNNLPESGEEKERSENESSEDLPGSHNDGQRADLLETTETGKTEIDSDTQSSEVPLQEADLENKAVESAGK